MLRRELGFRDITLFSIIGMVGVRWVGAAAHAGPGSILLWVAAALLLLVPLAIVVTALTVRDPEAGGIYRWSRRDFGPWHGFLSFWLYWVSTAIWLPGAAMFCVSAATTVFGSGHARPGESRVWLVSISLAAIWVGIGTNIIGVAIGKWTENLGAIATWVLALLLAVAAALAWRSRGSATVFHVVPQFNWDTVNFWASIAFAMTGFEVVGMMAGELRNPARDLPRAAWVTSAVVITYYAGLTAVLLVLMPPESVSDLNGITQSAETAAAILGASWLVPAVGLLVVFAMIGQFGSLGSAVARMPFAAGADHLMPAKFALLHPRWATPWFSMMVFGAIGSALLILAQLGDTARAAYQTIVSMTVIAGMLPFFYIFGSGWKVGKRWCAISGWFVTAVALVAAVIPPSGVQPWLFEIKLAAATLAMVGSGFLVYRRQARQSRAEIFAASTS